MHERMNVLKVLFDSVLVGTLTSVCFVKKWKKKSNALSVDLFRSRRVVSSYFFNRADYFVNSDFIQRIDRICYFIRKVMYSIQFSKFHKHLIGRQILRQ